MERFLYLTIDLLSILFPFIFSFYPKANFSKKWKYLWPAILFPALFFIAWDEWFTSMGVWGFNPRYISGVYFFHLPIEEVLFFICIPYACVFTYEAVNFLSPKDHFIKYHRFISIVLAALLFFVGLLNLDKWYTCSTFLLCAAFVALQIFWKSNYMSRFYFAFIFILIPFFIVNGLLTGSGIEEEVVWYNDAENLGIRMGTIPFEDTFYGMLMILMNISIFEWMQKKKALTQSLSS
jgi:lycopene cyclase domain-containing protein